MSRAAVLANKPIIARHQRDEELALAWRGTSIDGSGCVQSTVDLSPNATARAARVRRDYAHAGTHLEVAVLKSPVGAPSVLIA